MVRPAAPRRWKSFALHSGLALAVAALAAVAAGTEDPTLPVNNPGGPRYPEFVPGVMVDSAEGDDACSGLGIQQGWELVKPTDITTPRRLEGEVVAGHPPHGDFYFNHDTEDYTFYVFPDNKNPRASNPLTDYRALLGSGNFITGEPKAHGLIEVEWEYGAHSWNDAAGNNYYGFPTWAWPTIGDRVLVEGFWIFDCGHEEESPGWRTEIHPARLVVTYRNAANSLMARASNRKGWVTPLSSDDRDFSPVTRADVFASSFGGEVVDNLFDDEVFYGPDLEPPRPDWWQPVNDKNYDFIILAPPKPSTDAVMVVKVLDPPSDYIMPPGAVHPAFDPATHITPITQDGLDGVNVHIPFSAVNAADYMIFAKTIIVGWDVPQPDVMHFRMTVNRWNIFDDLEPETEETEYSAWALSRDKAIFVRLSDGGEDDESDLFECDSDGNYMPQCDIDSNENSYADGSLDVFIRPEDSLVFSFRAKEGDTPFNENDDLGIAEQAFTAAENWGIGTHHLFQHDRTFAGDHPDFFVPDWPLPTEENPCDDEGPDDLDTCYEVTYTIERIFDPTTTTIGVPAAQYAQDPILFTAKVVTPGSPEKPRRRLPVGIQLSGAGGTQTFNSTTGDDGVARPNAIITLPAGAYTDDSSFGGNGLLQASAASVGVTILKDPTSTTLTIENEIRWGHRDPMTVTLIEPNVGQSEPPLGVEGKNVVISFNGPLGSKSYTAGPTDASGNATITPLMDLPPGNYQVKACFAEDPWFLGSCTPEQTVKVTAGFAAFASGGPITITGTTERALGDLHSESSVVLTGSTHVISAAANERLEYVTTLTDQSTGSKYNAFQVPALGIKPTYLASTYCSGDATLMGVPITYIKGNHTFHNGAVLSGIYCVSGDIKIQSDVTGSAVLVAAGTIGTSGGGQNLKTADPTGADVLLLSGSNGDNAISVSAPQGRFVGVIVATGGVEIASQEQLADGGVIGRLIAVKGMNNVLDGRTSGS